MWSGFLFCKLISDSGIAVFKIYYAAAFESEFCHQMLHDFIVVMGIDPEIIVVAFAEGQTFA